MKTLIPLIAATCFIGATYAQQANQPTKPMPAEWTAELMMRVRQITSVQPSPDGKRVAFAVKAAIMETTKSEYLTHIHIANVDGTEPFQLTQGEKSCTNPQWSPDGTCIAFISSRGGSNSDVWLIRMGGGEAQVLTDVKTSVIACKWSPDGKQMAYTAPEPPTPDEEKANKEMTDARVVDENIKMNRLYVIPVEKNANGKREARRLTPGDFSVGDFDWSPDGKTIAFSHTRTPRDDDWPSADISLVDVAAATIMPLVNTGAAERSPFYSPDGHWIACVASDDPPTWGTDDRVQLVPVTGGATKKLAATFDQQPTLVGWSADGKRIFYTEYRGTTTRLCALPLSGTPEEVSTGEGVLSSWVLSVNLNCTHSMFGFSFESVGKPAEGFVSSTVKFEPRQVTQVNKEFLDLALGRTEVLRWKSVDGLEIEGLLTYPAGYLGGRRYPLLLVVHGGPTDVFRQEFIGSPHIYYHMYPVAVFAARGYAVLRCNPRGSSGYGREFRHANYEDWGGKDYQDLMAGVDHVIELGVADGDRLGVMGWSYGGYMTSWIITQTKRFKAASVGAGISDLVNLQGTSDLHGDLSDYLRGELWDRIDVYCAHSAIFHVKGVNTPTLIQHGEKDERVPVSQGYELYHALKGQGCAVKMVVYPRTAHIPDEPKLVLDIMNRNLDWFDKYVRGSETK